MLWSRVGKHLRGIPKLKIGRGVVGQGCGRAEEEGGGDVIGEGGVGGEELREVFC